MPSTAAYRNAPVRETCPSIDGIISELEELRASNSKLRDWGAEEYDRAEEAEQKLSEAEDTISELEDAINDLRGELEAINQSNAA